METVRPCGCKGIRTCLICEKQFNISKPNLTTELQKLSSYVYCPECDLAWPGWNLESYKQHPNHEGDPISYPGVYIQLNFLTENEAKNLMDNLDELSWDSSQSGRRKQNYGPKCNFKRRKLQLGNFNGFPKKTKFVQDKFKHVPLLENFQTIEQCSLEYTPERGASIDPHIDDCWIWGERIVTVNVIGDSVLTMIPYRDNEKRYNLKNVSTYCPIVFRHNSNDKNIPTPSEQIVVRLPMPARSLMVLFGASRYNWEHAVLREDVKERRVCIAYREFTPPYLQEGQYSNESIEIYQKAQNFW
ncbi:alpha-ketoglutarate-dependent dioxygenase alkB homolog 4 [Chelonus insularis]|uniref:alpha-ketoglutarate-dependent dioxygenase alkB homolog 4 n=1 Tax=Chelonus insularis TaxID=460826 RepID=UPI00158CD90A|nr:alpha-ketoglutarate-dependent dioxygenase alkB homolog 4 [Chelonus insularis]